MIRFAATVAAIVLLASTCNAQEHDHTLLYGTFTLAHAGTVRNDGPPGYDGTTSVTSPDVGVGVTFNVHHFPAATLGLDLRLALQPDPGNADSSTANPSSVHLFLFGVKLAGRVPKSKLTPYIQLSTGFAGASTPDISGIAIQGGGNVSSTWGVFEVLGGLDYNITHRLDLRLVEFGAGRGGGIAADGNPPPGTGFYTASTGLVIRF